MYEYVCVNRFVTAPESKVNQRKRKGKQTTLMKTPPGKQKPQAEADRSPTDKEQLEKKTPTAKK